MLTDERKAVVDHLSDDELELEVKKGRRSRFQGEAYDYARVSLTRRKESAQKAAHKEVVAIQQQNRNATRMAWIVALLVGIAAVLINFLGRE